MACRKCGKDNGWYSLDLPCRKCKNKSGKLLLMIAIPLAFISMIIGGLLGNIGYDYDLDKCKNMDTSDVKYEFTHDVQLDVRYSQNCYYMNNHPMAKFWSIFGGALIGLLMIIFLSLMASMIIYL